MKHFEGIKFNSLFNSLHYFHVSQPGLPFCLGHDLLEGIVSHDVPLVMTYFVRKKWFTYELLNRRIDSFQYSTHDQRDKPTKIPPKCNRLVGGAWQLLTFIRLFPLLIGDKIQNIDDDVWISFLRLTEIVEIVCSPEVHKDFIPYLSNIVDEYLGRRTSLFPETKLRPKHHSLTHYAEMLGKLGPLMKVFTLRFESKHTFFKRTMRVLRCFKNITLSLAEKHELFQSYLRAGAGSRDSTQILDITELRIHNFSNAIQSAIVKANTTRKFISMHWRSV